MELVTIVKSLVNGISDHRISYCSAMFEDSWKGCTHNLEKGWQVGSYLDNTPFVLPFKSG